VLAAGGELVDTRAILGVARAGGEVRATAAPVPRRVADPAEAYLVTSALEGAVARGTGRGLNGLGHRDGLAGKSGTSSEWRDGWFVAYTPALVVAVWVGYDDGRSLGLTGSRSALPIVGRFLREALRQTGGESFAVPDGLEYASVGTDRGWWGWECAGEPEVFLEGTAPDDRCGDRWMPRRWVSRLDDHADEFVNLLEEHADQLAGLVEERAEALLALLAERLAERARRGQH
jgi:penicillin-binding protein 1A